MEVEFEGKKYTILDKPKWKHIKEMMKLSKGKKSFLKNPQLVDWMLKNFVVKPKLTNAILDNMDVDEIAFLIIQLQKLQAPLKDNLVEIKKKLST